MFQPFSLSVHNVYVLKVAHNIYALQGSDPTYKEIVMFPNKVILWRGMLIPRKSLVYLLVYYSEYSLRFTYMLLIFSPRFATHL